MEGTPEGAREAQSSRSRRRDGLPDMQVEIVFRRSGMFQGAEEAIEGR
jgi:hypothetical protein